jgi:diguanylate cyclase (GGDEF)-like protein
LGGDEFVILLHEIANLADVEVFARKINEAIAAEFNVGEIPINISASIGIAVYPLHGETCDLLLAAADEALYHAKHAGKNQFFISKGKPCTKN